MAFPETATVNVRTLPTADMYFSSVGKFGSIFMQISLAYIAKFLESTLNECILCTKSGRDAFSGGYAAK
jgi:hypothetical protein